VRSSEGGRKLQVMGCDDGGGRERVWREKTEQTGCEEHDQRKGCQ
jgi:hypothetical protein